MAYEKTVWQTGDIVTSEKLNKMEAGIEAAQTMVVHVTYINNNQTLDKTYAEIFNALEAGVNVKIIHVGHVVGEGVTEVDAESVAIESVLLCSEHYGEFEVESYSALEHNRVTYTCTSLSGYPNRVVGGVT